MDGSVFDSNLNKQDMLRLGFVNPADLSNHYGPQRDDMATDRIMGEPFISVQPGPFADILHRGSPSEQVNVYPTRFGKCVVVGDQGFFDVSDQFQLIHSTPLRKERKEKVDSQSQALSTELTNEDEDFLEWPVPANTEEVEYRSEWDPAAELDTEAREHHAEIRDSAFADPVTAVARASKVPKQRLVPKGERAEKTMRVDKVLKFQTIDQASRRTQPRTALRLKVADDVETVAGQDATAWIHAMLRAFDTAERETPHGRLSTQSELDYFKLWQDESHNRVVKSLLTKGEEDPDYAEKRVWEVLIAVVDFHRNGAPTIEDDKATFKSNLTMTCSTRMKAIVDGLTDYCIVRHDVLSRSRIDQLVADPNAFVRRKLTNVFVNHKKREQAVGLAKTPTKSATNTPSKVAAKTPAKAAAKTPSKSAAKTPSKSAAKTPSKSMSNTPNTPKSSGKRKLSPLPLTSDEEATDDDDPLRDFVGSEDEYRPGKKACLSDMTFRTPTKPSKRSSEYVETPFVGAPRSARPRASR